MRDEMEGRHTECNIGILVPDRITVLLYTKSAIRLLREIAEETQLLRHT